MLRAEGHRGGLLDWWAFDVDPGATLGASGDTAPLAIASTTLPGIVQLDGLPAQRFWQFESGDVNMDAVSAAPEDLGRLLFTEFAVAYGNDFFLLPLELAIGSITRVTSLSVRTTFGDVLAVPPSDVADATAQRDAFHLFRPRVRDTADPAAALLLVPTVVEGLAGSPVEDVLVSRDEMANVAWGVERLIAGPDGRGTERADELRRTASEPEDQAGTRPRYQLVTSVPANWLSLYAASTDSSGALRPVLRLNGQPVGRILSELTEHHAERLGREGIRARRMVQRARTADGRTIQWMTRRTSTGRGESSSGLRFDQLT